MAKSFSEFLADQKKSSPGLKEKVNIATAGTTFYLNHIKEKGLGRQYIETNKVSNAGTKLTEDFRNDIEMLDGTDYRGFVGFIRKYQTALNELPKNRNLSPEDRKYVEAAIKDPLTQIATIRGPVLRLAYGLEDLKKEFKPLKLADRLLGDVPIIGSLIKEKIEDIEEGEQAVIKAGRDAAKQKARELQKSLGLDEDEGDDFVDTGDTVSPGAGAQTIEKELTTERLEDEGRLNTTPSFGLGRKKQTEEQRKEANIEREETQNIFEAIMMNTQETNEILRELTDAYREENEGMGEFFDKFGVGLGLGLPFGGKGGKTPNVKPKGPKGNLINYVSDFNNVVIEDFFTDLNIIAIGSRSNENQPSENTMLKMALVEKNKNYYLLGLIIQNDNALFVNENFNGRIWRIDLGSDPKKTDEKGNSWISYYGIEIGRTNQFHSNLNIEGAMWAKNICLDDKAVNWEFKEDFINRFIIRYGQDFNYGVPYYRGSSITTWDTMRDFSS